MKIAKPFLAIIPALACCLYSFSQTVDEIVEKHIDAMGGKEKLASITSMHMDHTANFMGTDAPSSTTVLSGKGFRNESEFNGQKVVRVYTDKSGWSINPFAGSDDPQALPDEQYKAGEDQIYIDPFLNYKDHGGKLELLGQEKLGSANVYKLKLTNKDNSSTTYYVDATTYYIVEVVSETSMAGQTMEVRSQPSDYKKIDFGIFVPQTIVVSIGEQFTMTSKLNKVEVNVPVDPSIFEMKK